MRAIWVLLPSTLLWGASFPLALGAVARTTSGSGTAGRRRLRRQHRRRDRRRARHRSGAGRHGRQPGGAADADRDCGECRVSCCWSASRRARTSRTHCASSGDGRSSPSSALAPSCSRASCRRCPACSSPTGALPRRGSASTRSSMSARASPPPSRCRAPPRRAQLPQRRQGPGVERAAGHEAAAHARSYHDARAEEPGQGAGDRLRRRRHRRRRVDRPDGQGPDDRGDRAARPAGRLHLLLRAQLRRRPQPEGSHPPGRRAALPPDDGREVRRDHVRPARSVGQGSGDALHARVFRGREGSPEPRRRRDAVRAALREQRRRREERDRDVPRGVPERRGVRQYRERPGVRPGPVRPARGPAESMSTPSRRGSPRRKARAIQQSLSEIGIYSAVELFGTYAGAARTWRTG